MSRAGEGSGVCGMHLPPSTFLRGWEGPWEVSGMTTGCSLLWAGAVTFFRGPVGVARRVAGGPRTGTPCSRLAGKLLPPAVSLGFGR